jgi:hypothetical protein
MEDIQKHNNCNELNFIHNQNIRHYTKQFFLHVELLPFVSPSSIQSRNTYVSPLHFLPTICEHIPPAK